jgi:hypothetical protein
MRKFNPFLESDYISLINEVGVSNYCIFEKDELMPNGVFHSKLNIAQYNCVFTCTAATASDYSIILKTGEGDDIIDHLSIPKGQPIVVTRLLRYCEHDGTPHYNADDQIFFQTVDGFTYRISRNDSPDHYIALADLAGIGNIANAYRLPTQKSGLISDFKANGAELHIEFDTKKGKRSF